MSKFLRGYFWFISLTFILLISFAIFDEVRENLIDCIDFVFWFIALVRLYSYSFNKDVINSKIFWKIYVPFLVVWDLFIMLKGTSFELQTDSLLSIFIVDGLYIIILLPQFFGLFLYAYKEKPV